MMEKLIENFCETKLIEDESTIFFKTEKGYECNLLFSAKKIIKISNFDKSANYDIRNFVINGNKLIFTGENITNLTADEYEGKDGDPFDLSEMKRYRIKRPYYSESYIVKKQLLITYEAAETFDLFDQFKNDSLILIKNKLSFQYKSRGFIQNIKTDAINITGTYNIPHITTDFLLPPFTASKHTTLVKKL